MTEHLAAKAQPEFGFDVLAAVIADRASGPIFGLLGDANLAPMARAAELGVAFKASRHESGAVAMATGHALASGLVTLVTTTRGPGFTNALAALTSAVRDRAPLVFIAGASSRTALPGAQVIDQQKLVGPTGAGFLSVTDGSAFASAIDSAFAMAGAERRPIVVDIPSNLLHEPARTQRSVERVNRAVDPAPGAPDPAAIREIAGRLERAERPVILAGRGAVDAGAGPLLRRLGEAAGALMVTSLPAMGLFGDDPYSVGFSGGFALARTRQLLAEADLVLVVGASFNRYTLAEDTLFRDTRVIQIDRDPEAIGRYRHVELGLVGDAAETTAALVDAIGPRTTTGFRTQDVATRIAASDYGRDVPERHGDGSLDPRAVLRAVDAGLPGDRRVVVDVGHFSTFPCQVFPVREPGQLLPAFGFGAVGLGLATGIGVSIADPARPVVIVVGDGGLLMSLGELDSLARLGGPITVVVMNDAAYGAEVHHLRHAGLSDQLARFPPRNFAALAATFGIDGVQVKTAGDLDALPGFVSRSRPVLIDALINPGVIADRFTLATAR